MDLREKDNQWSSNPLHLTTLGKRQSFMMNFGRLSLQVTIEPWHEISNNVAFWHV